MSGRLNALSQHLRGALRILVLLLLGEHELPLRLQMLTPALLQLCQIIGGGRLDHQLLPGRQDVEGLARILCLSLQL